jgi:hypothetical protein
MKAFRVGLFGVGLALASEVAHAEVTFAKDIAPILEAKCQSCHQSGTVAPMPLVTYEDVRPWIKSMKRQVVSRQMPPWHVSKRIGIQQYKNDRSLSDREVRIIVQWVDAGAPFGNERDLPPPISWPDDETWTIGKPDLIVASPAHTMEATGPDFWGDFTVETRLTEDRYIKAIETKPSKAGRRAVHHALTFLASDGPGTDESYLSEYAIGKHGDIFPPGVGRLITAGSKLRFNMHYHATGERIVDRTSVGFVFYPRGYVPQLEVSAINVGLQLLDNDLDIPANRVAIHQAAIRLEKTAKIISFQPHMHMRGKAMVLEAVDADGHHHALGAVDDFDFNWQDAYVFDDAVAPILPKGTVLHAIATYDNTRANRRNPDPFQWVGFGNRSIDEMFQCHVLVTYLRDDDGQR